MKGKILLVGFAIVLVLSWGAPAIGETYCNYLEYGGTWQDANKIWDGDRYMCWAASASNVLAWGGWGTAEYSTANEIYSYMTRYLPNADGAPANAVRFWFQGEGSTEGGGFFPSYPADNYLHFGGLNPPTALQDIASLLQDGQGVCLAILSPHGAHAITVWGYDYNPAYRPEDSGYYTHLYYTDSDDRSTELCHSAIEWDASIDTAGRWVFTEGRLQDMWFDYCVGLERFPYIDLPGGFFWVGKEALEGYYDLKMYLSLDLKWEPPFPDPQPGDPRRFLVQIGTEDDWLTIYQLPLEQSDMGWQSLNIPIDQKFMGVQKLRFLVEGEGEVCLYRLNPATYSYDFTFTYGTGDSYGGKIYADAAKYGITPNPLWTWTTVDENGLPGTYVLSNASLVPGYHPNEVYVNWYVDHESGKPSYIPLGSGKPVGTGLGTEGGYIIKAGTPDFRFGYEDGILYEADLPARFSYTFTYSNGDSYTGSVYASQWDAYPELMGMGKTWYQPGEVWSIACEDGLTGKYVIGQVIKEYFEDTTNNGRVTVDSYYDVEMKRSYVPTFASGSNYLGSEYGFLVTNRPSAGPPYNNLPPGILKKFFGYDGVNHYEADIEQDKKKQEDITYTAPVAMTVANAMVSYQPEEQEESKRKRAK